MFLGFLGLVYYKWVSGGGIGYTMGFRSRCSTGYIDFTSGSSRVRGLSIPTLITGACEASRGGGRESPDERK